MAVGIGANMVIAFRVRPPFRPMSSEQQNLERYRVALEPRKKLILAVVMVIVGLAAGASAQGNWRTWLLFFNGGSFGVTDPQFHKDISFFAWDYPAYRTLLSFGFSLVIFSLLFAVAVHYLVRRDQAADARPEDDHCRSPARHDSGLPVHRPEGDRLLARPLRTGLLQPGPSHRCVLHRRERVAAGQDDPVLDRGDHRRGRPRLALAQERAASGHRLRRAADPEHRDQRHLSRDRPAGHGEAEREPEGSEVHKPKYPGHQSRLRHPERNHRRLHLVHAGEPARNVVAGLDEPDRQRHPDPRPQPGIADVHSSSSSSRASTASPASSTSIGTPSTARRRTTSSVSANSTRATSLAIRPTGSTSTPSTPTATAWSRRRPTSTSPPAPARGRTGRRCRGQGLHRRRHPARPGRSG